MSRFIDLTGQKFGRLTVLRMAEGSTKRGRLWVCLCEDGNERVVAGVDLKRNMVKSCGCLRDEAARENIVKAQKKALTHGECVGRRRSREYNAWVSMKSRCCCPNSQHYHRYGERGITVCARWMNSFQAFLEDMGRCPPGRSLDRVDNDKGYSPENCRWATKKEQADNRSDTIWVVLDGKRMTTADASRSMGFWQCWVVDFARRRSITHQEACDILAKRRRKPPQQ